MSLPVGHRQFGETVACSVRTLPLRGGVACSGKLRSASLLRCFELYSGQFFFFCRTPNHRLLTLSSAQTNRIVGAKHEHESKGQVQPT